jgi:hypothetical protein
MSREEALRLVEEYDGKRPEALDRFLEDTGMTEEEFNRLSKKHIVKQGKKIETAVESRK